MRASRAGGRQHLLPRAGGGLLALVVTVSAVGLLSGATADAAKKPTKKSTTAPALASLKIQTPNVEVMKKGKSAFVAAQEGQALRQGDALRTDPAGFAEIAYTDGSLTRLGPSTEFLISKLTNKKGVRQTQGTLTVGSTWNRAAKVSESGSFEIKAGGATAAVEGTSFAVVCTEVGAALTCEFIDVSDPVKVTTSSGALVAMGDGMSVIVVQGVPGVLQKLTYDQLAGNLFIAGNLLLDLQAGIGGGLSELGSPPSPTPEVGGGGTPGPGATATGPTVTAEGPDLGAGQYPPDGTIVVDDPNVEPGGEVVFRGGGCVPNETLQVFFDGTQVGTIVSDAQGNFEGTFSVPVDAAPGSHLLTVKGSGCELNITINVLGGLAFTGASNDTGTTVLVGIAAVAFGLVLVFGTRRRRTTRGSRAGSHVG